MIEEKNTTDTLSGNPSYVPGYVSRDHREWRTFVYRKPGLSILYIRCLYAIPAIHTPELLRVPSQGGW